MTTPPRMTLGFGSAFSIFIGTDETIERENYNTRKNGYKLLGDRFPESPDMPALRTPQICEFADALGDAPDGLANWIWVGQVEHYLADRDIERDSARNAYLDAIRYVAEQSLPMVWAGMLDFAHDEPKRSHECRIENVERSLDLIGDAMILPIVIRYIL